MNQKNNKKEGINHQENSQDPIIDSVRRLDEKVTNFQLIVEEFFSKNRTKDQFYEKVFQELCQYKENFIWERILKRIFLDVICLYDRILELKEQMTGNTEILDIHKHVESLGNEIEHILRRQGITKTPEEGRKFNEEYQEAIQVTATDDPEENLKIDKVVKVGFMYDARFLLRPEKVIVKKYYIKKEKQNGESGGN